jgi:hypothetical protein
MRTGWVTLVGCAGADDAPIGRSADLNETAGAVDAPIATGATVTERITESSCALAPRGRLRENTGVVDGVSVLLLFGVAGRAAGRSTELRLLVVDADELFAPLSSSAPFESCSTPEVDPSSPATFW